MQLDKSISCQDDSAHFYDYPHNTETEVSDVVITYTIFVHDRMTTILFDLGSTNSYLLAQFALLFDVVFHVIRTPVHVSTSIEEFVIVNSVYHACFVMFIVFLGFHTSVDLVILDMIDLDISIGMNSLSPYYVLLYNKQCWSNNL